MFVCPMALGQVRGDTPPACQSVTLQFLCRSPVAGGIK
jgi:hypothetical protein